MQTISQNKMCGWGSFILWMQSASRHEGEVNHGELLWALTSARGIFQLLSNPLLFFFFFGFNISVIIFTVQMNAFRYRHCGFQVCPMHLRWSCGMQQTSQHVQMSFQANSLWTGIVSKLWVHWNKTGATAEQFKSLSERVVGKWHCEKWRASCFLWTKNG